MSMSNAWFRADYRPFEADHAPERLGEVRHIALDSSRAREVFGWDAQVDLRDGLARTLKFTRAS